MTDHPQLDPPALLWRANGTPVSGRFGDIYFSPEDGLAETTHVFLRGTGLPEQWAGRERFVIGETGFGTGLNMLAVWDLWRRTGPERGVLHFLSVEAHPLSPRQMRRAHAAWPQLSRLSARFLELYDTPLPGVHRLHVPEDRFHLTLLHGEAREMLSRIDARVDAWFLDGFSPSRNGAMWAGGLFRELARLSAGDARLATFTVAGHVRRGLAEAGFEVEKAPGFGAKRDMLRGRFTGGPAQAPGRAVPPWFARPRPRASAPAQVTVIGAGIAGASLAAAFARRNIPVTLIDRTGALAQGASGNPRALVMPRLTVDPTVAGQLHTAGFAYTTRLMKDVPGHAPLTGLVQLATSPADWCRQQALITRRALPPDWLRPVTRREASDLAGVPVDRPGLFHPMAGALDPVALIRHLAEDPLIELRHGEVQGMTRAADHWRLSLTGPDGAQTLLEAGTVILANGMAASLTPDGACLSLRASLGQLVAMPAPAHAGLRRPVTFGGYAAPADDGRVLIGASYDNLSDWSPGLVPAPDAAARREILAKAAGFLPDLLAGSDTGTLHARAAIRATTPDHLPVMGAMPHAAHYEATYGDLHKGRNIETYPQADDRPDLYVLTGLGSRGFVTAPLLGETLVSGMLGDPLPLEADLLEALHPARFVIRALRRGQPLPGSC